MSPKLGVQEILEFIKINSVSYHIIHCIHREPAGVVNQGRISATRYKGIYKIRDGNGKERFAVIDDYQTEYARVAEPKRTEDRLFDLFDDNGNF